jgi:hypothetical protein
MIETGSIGPLLRMAIVAVAWGPSAANAEDRSVQIDASVTYVFNSLRPNLTSNIPVTHSYQVTLSGANQVDEQRTSQSGTTRVLGQSGSEGKTGGAWRVAGPHSLVRERDLPQSTETLTIAVQGQSCEISVSNRLKPGFSEFKYPRVGSGEWQYFSAPQVTSTSCVIR